MAPLLFVFWRGRDASYRTGWRLPAYLYSLALTSQREGACLVLFILPVVLGRQDAPLLGRASSTRRSRASPRVWTPCGSRVAPCRGQSRSQITDL